eukprot:243029-Ditylum_brightwellii.AAC.1
MADSYKMHYKNNIFEYPELMQINGEPTTATLLTLKNEVKANAQSVFTMLGGGQFRHLGLVCNAAAYTNIPGTAHYLHPVQPVLNLPTGGTQFQIQQANTTYKQALQLFNKVNAVEQALIQQIVAAIKPKYIKAIQHSATKRITKTIPQIFDHLLDNYGDITPEELRELKIQVKGLTYSPAEPVNTFFTKIEELADVAELAKIPSQRHRR